MVKYRCHSYRVPFKSRKVQICGDFGCFSANAGRFRGGGATLRARHPFLSPGNLTQDHSVKKEWLITDATAVGSPVRAECGFSVKLGFFGQLKPLL